MRTLRLLAIVACSAVIQGTAIITDALTRQELALQARDLAERKARRAMRDNQSSPPIKTPGWLDEAFKVREDEA